MLVSIGAQCSSPLELGAPWCYQNNLQHLVHHYQLAPRSAGNPQISELLAIFNAFILVAHLGGKTSAHYLQREPSHRETASAL